MMKDAGLPVRHMRFNSIKVQLELFEDGFAKAQLKFQFHKGSIRIASACGIFYSYAVSIP